MEDAPAAACKDGGVECTCSSPLHVRPRWEVKRFSCSARLLYAGAVHGVSYFTLPYVWALAARPVGAPAQRRARRAARLNLAALR